nr:hypothetical protein [Massilia sp. JS1662]
MKPIETITCIVHGIAIPAAAVCAKAVDLVTTRVLNLTAAEYGMLLTRYR